MFRLKTIQPNFVFKFYLLLSIFSRISKKIFWPKCFWPKYHLYSKLGPNVFGRSVTLAQKCNGQNVFVPSVSSPKVQWPKCLCPKCETVNISDYNNSILGETSIESYEFMGRVRKMLGHYDFVDDVEEDNR